MRVACIGEAMIELSAQGSTAQLGVAGDTLNTAIYLKRNAPELDVDYVTRLGTDPFSDRISAFIAQEDIGTAQIARDPAGSPGLYAITTDEKGERNFTYWRSNSAARNLFDDGDFSCLDAYDLIYLTGISLAILPDPIRAGLLDHVRANGLRMAFDNNYRPRLWENQETAARVTAAYWDAAAIALPSIDDEMELFSETAAQVKARWQKFDGIGALKQGPQGPMSIGPDPAIGDFAAAPKVIDTTAAGDSFCGAYLAAHLCGASQSQALHAGHAVAREVVQHRGAIIARNVPIPKAGKTR